MTDSILDSIKKVLGLAPDYTAFDADIIMHINSVLSDLNQLGVGLDPGFAIEDNVATWSAFLGDDPRLNNVKSYMFLRLKLLFDPPTTRYTISGLESQIKELEWRIKVRREGVAWVNPNPPPPIPDDDECEWTRL